MEIVRRDGYSKDDNVGYVDTREANHHCENPDSHPGCDLKIDVQGYGDMGAGIEVDRERKILRREVSGVLQTDTYKELVGEPSRAAKIHRNFDILVDLRRTVAAIGILDLMAIVSAWSRLGAHYCRKIAVVIPEVEERYRAAQIIRSYMDAKGFPFRQFFDLDSASEWLIGSAPYY
jgi:hypothetical protein